MPARARVVPGIALAGLVLLVACGDRPDATAPVARRPPARAAVSGGAVLYPNSHHYREQSYTHATGRSGNAVLTGRALLGKDGVTVVEATTGKLDSLGAPGSLKKVQAKLLDSTRVLERTTNYNGLRGGGSFLVRYPGRPRHSFVQLQANIEGIDPRTDVVTLTERVNLRPNISVRRVLAPPLALPNTPVLVSADVAETNGDVGATAACVLRVDGVVVDRIQGVWVANGDAVTCQFMPSLASGRHMLQVAAEGMVPADWDASDDTASAPIEVKVPEQPLSGWANFYSYVEDDTSSNTGSYRNSDGSTGVYRTDWIYNMRNQSGAVAGYIPATVSFPLAAGSYTSLETVNGTPMWIDMSGLAANNPNGCGLLLVGPDQAEVCPGPYYTFVMGYHSASSVEYFTRSISDSWDASGTWSHSEVTYPGSSSSNGIWIDPGNAVTFHLHVSDGVVAYGADPVLPLVPSLQSGFNDWGCSTQSGDGWYNTSCSFSQWVTRGLGGSIDF